jgi:hypothetical protein
MFGIGGFNFQSFLMQAALAAATGGASLTMTAMMQMAVKQVVSQIAMNVIQNLGQQMGLPQPMIDMAQASFAMQTGQPELAQQNLQEAFGNFADMFNASPMEKAQFQREMTQTVDDFIQGQMEAFKKGKEEGESSAQRNGRGKSWLQVIADALAKTMDNKIKQMDDMATKLDKQGDKKSIKASTDLQVAGQEFAYLMQTTGTIIKTVGEAYSGMLRKS